MLWLWVFFLACHERVPLSNSYFLKLTRAETVFSPFFPSINLNWRGQLTFHIQFPSNFFKVICKNFILLTRGIFNLTRGVNTDSHGHLQTYQIQRLDSSVLCLTKVGLTAVYKYKSVAKWLNHQLEWGNRQLNQLLFDRSTKSTFL